MKKNKKQPKQTQSFPTERADYYGMDRDPAEGGKLTIEEAIRIQSVDLPASEEPAIPKKRNTNSDREAA